MAMGFHGVERGGESQGGAGRNPCQPLHALSCCWSKCPSLTMCAAAGGRSPGARNELRPSSGTDLQALANIGSSESSRDVMAAPVKVLGVGSRG